MKFNQILALGSLLAMAGSALAAPVPNEGGPVRVVTVTRVKVMGVTRTKYIRPATASVSTTITTTTSSIESTTTSTSTEESSTEESTSTTSTTSSAEEEKEEETTTSELPTSTQTPERETTTTEEKKEEPTPPPPPPKEEEKPKEAPVLEEKPQEKPKDEEAPPPQTPAPGGDVFHGEATYYDPGMGSCGEVHGPDDMIAAISYQVMDPKNPGNPNNNPLCGMKVRCHRRGKPQFVATITIVDRCPVCVAGDLDLSPAAYKALGGTIAEGRFEIDCEWL